MEMENNKKIQEENPLKVLWVLLSALGLLIVVGTAGFFFFSPGRESGEVKPTLAATTLIPAEKAEEFDPIEWARESETYPDMSDAEEQDDAFIVELITEEEAEAAPEPVKPVPEAVVKPAPVKPAPEPEPEPQPVYRDEKVQVYWIQVGSYGTMTKAESVSSFLKEKGLSTAVQTRAVDGVTRYRVRIGAFNTKEEADKFNGQVRTIRGFEESYVVQSYITKKVPVGS